LGKKEFFAQQTNEFVNCKHENGYAKFFKKIAIYCLLLSTSISSYASEWIEGRFLLKLSKDKPTEITIAKEAQGFFVVVADKDLNEDDRRVNLSEMTIDEIQEFFQTSLNLIDKMRCVKARLLVICLSKMT